MNYKNMESGKEYLIQVSVGRFGFINLGYYGTYRGMEKEEVVLERATKLNLAKLAMGLEEGASVGDVRIPAEKIVYISP